MCFRTSKFKAPTTENLLWSTCQPNISRLSVHNRLWDFKLRKVKRKLAILSSQLLSQDPTSCKLKKKEYDRNRRHLLAVPEPAPAQWPFVASTPAYLAAAPHGSIAFHCVKCSSTASHHFKKGMLPVTSPATTAAKTSAEQSAVCSQSEVADKEAYQTPSSAKAFSWTGTQRPLVQRPQIVTRSGRISRPKPKYGDFVT